MNLGPSVKLFQGIPQSHVVEVRHFRLLQPLVWKGEEVCHLWVEASITPDSRALTDIVSIHDVVRFPLKLCLDCLPLGRP